MISYPNSHHESQTKTLLPFKHLEGIHQYDVCIVGAGYTGLSTAIHLAEKGLKVAVLEAKRVGWGASGRNGGQLGYGMAVLQGSLEKQFSKEDAKYFWDISVEAVDLFHTLCEKYDIDCDFKSGNMASAVTNSNLTELLEHAEIANGYGSDIYKTHDRKTTEDIIGSNRYLGSIISQKSGHINPLKYIMGLTNSAIKSGVNIYEESPVTEISYKNPATIKSNTGKILADYVVIACNGYQGSLNKKLAARILPIDNFQATTSPLDPNIYNNIIKGDMCIWDTSRSVHYFRKTPDHRLVMGCSIGLPNHIPRNIEAECRKHLEYVYPQLKDAPIDYIWSGTLGGNNRQLPDVGWLEPNILYAQSFTGHGVGLAPLVGKYMADVIHSESDKFNFLSKIKHKNIFGGRHLRIPAILVYKFMTNTMDKIITFMR